MSQEKHLFSPITLNNLEIKNRIAMPPMCQYSAHKKDGVANNWHFVHYASRAVGGTGLIIVEMTNVEPAGRISDRCLGLWDDAQIQPLKRIVDECHKYGSKMAIQIGHAGRKAEDAPEPVSASDVRFSSSYKQPRALSNQEVKEMVQKYKRAVERAVEAGFDAIEIHGAHGYLIHQFHSPLTNLRDDEYGKDKTLFGREVLRAAKEVMPEGMPLIFRLSATEYVEGGYGLDYAIEIAKEYMKEGIDVFHITSGGEGPIGSGGRPGVHGGYQVPMAREIKKATGLPAIAVGKLSDFEMANAVIGNEDADMVAIGRGMLRNPNWALEASFAIRRDTEIPYQLERAFPAQK